MRCPLCVSAGAEHVLHVDGHPPPNEMRHSEWWDERGRHHVHDPQRRDCHLRCSNQHHFTVTFISRCPTMNCEWNDQPEVTTGVGWPAPAEAPT